MGEHEQKQVLYPLLWVLLLVFVSWPIALVIAPIWVVLLPFEVLFDFVRECNLFLFKLMVWPKALSRAIVDRSGRFPSPFPRETSQPTTLDPLNLGGKVQAMKTDIPYELQNN